ncbi:MAG: 50S ribosome-binding GTPase, partial [Gammaproteobacteria bacterium]|nr:50S ribosome-binding GTPase [Gammaproteobacteria bacterium]
DQQIHTRLENLLADFEQLQRSVKHGCLMREGMTVVIAGQPNAGKSSLLNALAGRESAIVTEVPGTTRDLLREHINIDGLPLHIVDTAGLRETDDQVEKIGVDRAWEAIRHADRILMVMDDRNGITDADQSILRRFPEGPGLTIVRNKIDLGNHKPGLRLQEKHTEISLSATTGQGLELLREHLKQCVGYQTTSAEGEFTARRRHLDALQRANQSLLHARTQLGENRAGELAAEDLRLAQQALSEITGEFSSDDLLGKIFSDFCIGK